MAQNGQVPVTFSRHGQRYWTRFTSYQFAANRTECAIVFQEVQQAAATFPILFKKTARGYEPAGILSVLKDRPTPFVSPTGRWFASYVPSALRCYPFQAEPTGRKTADQTPLFQLKVDESSGLLSDDPMDEAFFDNTGAVSPALREVQVFLQARAAAHEATLALCHIINSLGLFEPITSHDGITLPPDKFGVSVQRLKTLSQVENLKLVDSGALFLIHAHQISLSHCGWLAQAHQQLAQQNPQEKYTENSDISGFLYAMANAQNEDFLGTSGV